MISQLPSNRIINVGSHLLIYLLVFLLTAGSWAVDVRADSRSLEMPAPADPAQFCEDVTEIPQVECEALVALYQATGGGGWVLKSGWLESNTPCSWHGVICADGLVNFLDLPFNGLTGNIPTDLAALTGLAGLNLSHNQLSGSIPSELSTLAGLEWLNLGENQLSGSILSELSTLANLREIDLGNNLLTGDIPPQMGGLSALRELDLSNNQFEGSIPVELTALPGLIRLDLGDNQLSGSLPPELGGMAALEMLYLDNNQFSGSIPPEIADNLHLDVLDLSDNMLTGSIPPEIGTMWITELDLARNQLIGSIPPELGLLSAGMWFRLDLSNNQISGSIPPELGNIDSLGELNLSNNQLSGSIPPELSIVLGLLDLSGNQLTGSIPPIESYFAIDLSDNQLSGSIPPELFTSESGRIDLSNNQLSCSLPEEISLLNVSELYLQNNALQGEIPSAFIHLPYLTDLDLGYNVLWTSDPVLRRYLADRDPDWEATQTLPPTDLSVSGATANSLELAWQPIEYTQDGGYYEVSWAQDRSGPFTVHGVTSDKTSAAYLADGLPGDTTLYFQVRTYTPAHGDQQNALWSSYTPVFPVVLANISPGAGGSLAYVDADGSTTQVDVPAGAVSQPVVMTFNPLQVAEMLYKYQLAGQAFALSAFANGTPVLTMTLQTPLTISIEYPAVEVHGLVEDELLLLHSDGEGGWSDAASTCTPAGSYNRHPEQDWLVVEACRTGSFALPRYTARIFLPISRFSNTADHFAWH